MDTYIKKKPWQAILGLVIPFQNKIQSGPNIDQKINTSICGHSLAWLCSGTSLSFHNNVWNHMEERPELHVLCVLTWTATKDGKISSKT